VAQPFFKTPFLHNYMDLTHVNFGFLFAPHFHKAMKNVARTRKELGVRTLFNLLGPLSNPASSITK